VGKPFSVKECVCTRQKFKVVRSTPSEDRTEGGAIAANCLFRNDAHNSRHSWNRIRNCELYYFTPQAVSHETHRSAWT
jgi:hypothetical protein